MPNHTHSPRTSCSTADAQHMTPHRSDFIGELQEYEILVETANGGLGPVTHKGTVKVKLIDITDVNKSKMIYLNDVLYVPDLNRRILSVSEWNQCGGEIFLLHDRCRIRLLNDDNSVNTFIDLEPKYASGDVQNNSVHAVHKPPTGPKIQQSLMHKCLAHRSVSAIQLAQDDKLWTDVTIIEDHDPFCEMRKITTARKANRGVRPLDDFDDKHP